MTARRAPIAALVLLALALAACGASAPSSSAPADPAARPTPVPTVPPTVVEPGDDVGDPLVPDPADVGDVGGVDSDYPVLAVEDDEANGSLLVILTDPAARAWRVTVAGGDAAGDRLELIVETGDDAPSIALREFRGGSLVDEEDLSRIATDPTVAAGGCHSTLPVCYSSGDLRLPADGDGTLAVGLTLVAPDADLVITGGIARWPGEPFVLGPWIDTEPFRTGL